MSSAPSRQLILMIITSLLGFTSAEYTSQSKFQDSSIVGDYTRKENTGVSLDSVQYYKVTARSRLMCASSCSLTTSCKAVVFSQTEKICIVIQDFTAMDLVPKDGWSFMKKGPVLFKKGWLGVGGGSSIKDGRMMIRVDGQWGTVCDVSYNINYWPLGFCVDLGYEGILTARPASQVTNIGQATKLIHWQGVNCGYNRDFHRCADSDINFLSCGHEDDVVVDCCC